MASSKNSSKIGSDERHLMKDTMKEIRKSLCESGTMDRLKKEFEEFLETVPSHRENVQQLQTIFNSADRISYEEVFRKLGGPEFAEQSKEDDFDAVLTKLVKEIPTVALSESEKEELFKKWDQKFTFPPAQRENLYELWKENHKK